VDKDNYKDKVRSGSQYRIREPKVVAMAVAARRTVHLGRKATRTRT
jgi:hypothetical protein